MSILTFDFSHTRIERYAESSGADERTGLAPGLLHTAKQASVKCGPTSSGDHGRSQPLAALHLGIRSQLIQCGNLVASPGAVTQTLGSCDPNQNASSSGPRTTAEMASSALSTQQASSPQLSSGDFGSSTGSNNTVGATGADPDGLPEQKIFPGIVHETVRRGSMLSQPSGDDHHH